MAREVGGGSGGGGGGPSQGGATAIATGASGAGGAGAPDGKKPILEALCGLCCRSVDCSTWVRAYFLY